MKSCVSCLLSLSPCPSVCLSLPLHPSPLPSHFPSLFVSSSPSTHTFTFQRSANLLGFVYIAKRGFVAGAWHSTQTTVSHPRAKEELPQLAKVQRSSVCCNLQEYLVFSTTSITFHLREKPFFLCFAAELLINICWVGWNRPQCWSWRESSVSVTEVISF